MCAFLIGVSFLAVGLMLSFFLSNKRFAPAPKPSD